MTHEEAEALEKKLEPCTKCGGKLLLSGYSGDGHPKGLEHVTIRCKKCGNWYGGLTSKKRGESDAT